MRTRTYTWDTFSAIFYTWGGGGGGGTEDNVLDFLFVFVCIESLLKGIYSDRNEFAPNGANSFLSDKIPFKTVLTELTPM